MESSENTLKEEFRRILRKASENGEIPVQQQHAGYYEKIGTNRDSVKTRALRELVKVLSEQLSGKFLSLTIDKIQKDERYAAGVDQKKVETYDVQMSLDLTPPPIQLKPYIDLMAKWDGAEIERFSYKFEISIEARFDQITVKFSRGGPLQLTLGHVKVKIAITGETNGWPFMIEATPDIDLPYSMKWTSRRTRTHLI